MEKPIVKICDFGISYSEISNTVLTTMSSLKKQIGTPCYAGPEYFDEDAENVTRENDIYSFALTATMIYYANRKTPFDNVMTKINPGSLMSFKSWVGTRERQNCKMQRQDGHCPP